MCAFTCTRYTHYASDPAQCDTHTHTEARAALAVVACARIIIYNELALLISEPRESHSSRVHCGGPPPVPLGWRDEVAQRTTSSHSRVCANVCVCACVCHTWAHTISDSERCARDAQLQSRLVACFVCSGRPLTIIACGWFFVLHSRDIRTRRMRQAQARYYQQQKIAVPISDMLSPKCSATLISGTHTNTQTTTKNSI